VFKFCGAAVPSSETADSGKVPAIVTENMPGAGCQFSARLKAEWRHADTPLRRLRLPSLQWSDRRPAISVP
jgi:hypothetical protein